MWLGYQNEGDVSKTAMYFRPLKYVPDIEVAGSETITLRKRRVRKVDAQFDRWEIAIGMDSLFTTAARDFIAAWWASDYAWIHPSADSETEPVALWIEVTLPLGALPFTYPTGHKGLPSFSATIYATEGT